MENFANFVEHLAEFDYDTRRHSSAALFSELPEDTQKECVAHWKSWGKTYAKKASLLEQLTKKLTEKQVVVTNIASIHFVCTFLMKRAGKGCDQYASDLLLDFRTLDLLLRFDTIHQFAMYFGFRDNGVDHTSFVASRLQNGFSYKELYRLDVDKSRDTAVLTQLL